MSGLLTVNEVAQLFKMSEERIYELTREGILPAVRFGRSIRWNSERINQFIEDGGKALPGGWRRVEK